jgi:hypothetical protein
MVYLIYVILRIVRRCSKSGINGKVRIMGFNSKYDSELQVIANELEARSFCIHTEGYIFEAVVVIGELSF